jgi:RNA polymerase sigma-70 factor, ECF subfamily
MLVCEERELVERAKTLDKYAFNKLIEISLPTLKGYVLKMTGNKELSEDIVSETLLKGVININKFKPEGKFSTYLIAIATNVYRDMIKKNRILENFDEVNVMSKDLESQVIPRLEVLAVFKALRALSLEKRSTFILKYYYDYSYEAIAKILRCPVGTVRSRLHYCHEFLKENLTGGD